MAYADRTEVPFGRSIDEIQRLVRRAGAEQIGQFEMPGFYAVQFTLGDRMIRFRLPLPALEDIPLRDGHRRAMPPAQRQKRLDQARQVAD